MAYTPIRVKSSGDIQLETRENIEADFATEFVARVQDSMKYNTLSFAANQVEKIKTNILTDSKLLSPEEANDKYGVKGALQFQEPVREAEASRRAFKVLQEQDRAQFLAKESATENLAEKAGNFFIALGTLATDPVNYVPYGRLTQVYKLGRYAGQGTVAARIIKNPIARSSADAAFGNLVSQPFIAANHAELGLEYGVSDAMIDVGLGAVIGGFTGTVGSYWRKGALMSKREARAAQRTAQTELVNEFTKVLEAEQTALYTQLNNEGRAALDTYFEAVNQAGGSPSLDVVRAIGKLQNALNDNVKKNSALFLNDFLLRTDLSRLSPDYARALNESLQITSFIPDAKYLDIFEAFDLKAAGRLNELPKALAELVNRLGSAEGKISIKEFLQSSGLSFAKGKAAKAEIANLLGINELAKDGKLTAKQVFALFEEVNKIQKTQKAIQLEKKDLLKELFNLQQEIKGAKSNTLEEFDAYQKRFKELAEKFKDPDLRGLTLRDLEGLDLDTRANLIEYLKYFQEANPNEKQMRQALRGDEKALLEMHEQAKLNKEIKDTLTDEEALNILREQLKNGVRDTDLINNEGLLGADGIKLDTGKEIPKAFIDEQVAKYELSLDKTDLEEVNDLVATANREDEGVISGTLTSIKCGYGGG